MVPGTGFLLFCGSVSRYSQVTRKFPTANDHGMMPVVRSSVAKIKLGWTAYGALRDLAFFFLLVLAAISQCQELERIRTS